MGLTKISFAFLNGVFQTNKSGSSKAGVTIHTLQMFNCTRKKYLKLSVESVILKMFMMSKQLQKVCFLHSDDLPFHNFVITKLGSKLNLIVSCRKLFEIKIPDKQATNLLQPRAFAPNCGTSIMIPCGSAHKLTMLKWLR